MIATYENISTYLIDLAFICQYFKYVDDTSCGKPLGHVNKFWQYSLEVAVVGSCLEVGHISSLVLHISLKIMVSPTT